VGEQGRRRRGRAGATEAEERPCGSRTGGRRVGGVARGRRRPRRRAASQVALADAGAGHPPWRLAAAARGVVGYWESGRVRVICVCGLNGPEIMLGRIQSGPYVSIRVSYAQKYPKIIKIAGYISETYPIRIRIRYVSDTGYAR